MRPRSLKSSDKRCSRGMRRSSGEVTLGWVCSSEGKEGSRGKGQEGSWEAEDCGRRGEEEKDSGVPPTALRQDARGRSHPFEEDWEILDCRI